MKLTNLDQIVRRWLLENGLSIHYYAEGLFHASTCLRELHLDTLKVVNTLRLPLNTYHAVDLPEDFVEEVMVGIPVGATYQNVPRGTRINPLRVSQSTGDYTTYTNLEDDSESIDASGLWGPANWYWNFNEYGESTGRFFGIDGGAKLNGYEIVFERRQIQFTETFTSGDVLLMYISDGQSLNAASQIDVRAFSAIQSYVQWKRSINRDNNFSPEGQAYFNKRRLLRAALNGMSVADIKNILRKNYRATIKN